MHVQQVTYANLLWVLHMTVQQEKLIRERATANLDRALRELIYIYIYIFYLPSNQHDPRLTTHDPRPTTHDPRPTHPRDLASHDSKIWNTNYNQSENYDWEIIKFLERINNSQSKESLLWQYPTELMPNFTDTVSNKNSSWQFLLLQHVSDYKWWMAGKHIIINSANSKKIIEEIKLQISIMQIKWPSRDFWCLV